MQKTHCTQSEWSLLQILTKRGLALGLVVCAVSNAYAFSVGPLPGLNCGGVGQPRCDLTQALAQYEEVHQKITDEALRPLLFTPPSGAPLSFSSQAIQDIRDANAKTDYNQEDHSLHFDNAYLTQGGKRLIEGKEDVLLKQLRQQSTMSATQAKELREKLGGYLHTLQDFYSHSNYINLAFPPPIQLGDLPLSSQPSSPFPCDTTPGDGDTTLSPAASRNLLTTGFATNPLAAALAPFGQCAHGLLLNGIHKDWSGRNGHPEAKAQALIASRFFVTRIINDSSITNKDNVCMFMTDRACAPPPVCPDPAPNITATARTINSGRITKVQPGIASVSVSDGAASASASGSKGSGTATASGSDQVGGAADSQLTYTDSFLVTSPGKSGQGQAILILQVSASASEGSQVNSGVSSGAGSAFYQNIAGQIFGQPTATINFTYGSTTSLDFSISAAAGNQSIAGASSSGSAGYSVSVVGDSNAQVAWCRMIH